MEPCHWLWAISCLELPTAQSQIGWTIYLYFYFLEWVITWGHILNFNLTNILRENIYRQLTHNLLAENLRVMSISSFCSINLLRYGINVYDFKVNVIEGQSICIVHLLQDFYIKKHPLKFLSLFSKNEFLI